MKRPQGHSLSRNSPYSIHHSIEAAHCAVDAFFHQADYGLGRTLDGIVDLFLVLGRHLAENPADAVGAGWGLADADPQTGEVLVAEG